MNEFMLCGNMDYPFGKRRTVRGQAEANLCAAVAGGSVTRRVHIFSSLRSAHFHPVICPFYDNNIKLLPLIRLSLEGNEVDGGAVRQRLQNIRHKRETV